MLVKNADFDRDEFIYEINALFEASDRAGQVLWRPVVDAEKPAQIRVLQQSRLETDLSVRAK